MNSTNNGSNAENQLQKRAESNKSLLPLLELIRTRERARRREKRTKEKVRVYRKNQSVAFIFNCCCCCGAFSTNILCIVFSLWFLSSLLVSFFSFTARLTITYVFTLALLCYFSFSYFSVFSSATALLLFSGPDFQFILNGRVTRFIFSIHFVIFSFSLNVLILFCFFLLISRHLSIL